MIQWGISLANCKVLIFNNNVKDKICVKTEKMRMETLKSDSGLYPVPSKARKIQIKSGGKSRLIFYCSTSPHILVLVVKLITSTAPPLDTYSFIGPGLHFTLRAQDWLGLLTGRCPPPVTLPWYSRLGTNYIWRLAANTRHQGADQCHVTRAGVNSVPAWHTKTRNKDTRSSR